MAPKKANSCDNDEKRKRNPEESVEDSESSIKKSAKTRGKALSPEDQAKILKWRKERKTFVWIADQLGRKPHTIGYFCKDPTRYGTNKNGGRRSKVPDAKMELLAERVLNSTDSGCKIGKEFSPFLGVSVRQVERYVAEIIESNVNDFMAKKNETKALQKKVPSVKNKKFSDPIHEDTDDENVVSTPGALSGSRRKPIKRACRPK